MTVSIRALEAALEGVTNEINTATEQRNEARGHYNTANTRLEALNADKTQLETDLAALRAQQPKMKPAAA